MTAIREENTDIFDVIAIVWQRKWTVFVFLLLAQVVAGIVWINTPVRYFSRSQFIFKTTSANPGLSDLAALVGKRSGGSQTDISAYFDIILFTDEFLEPLLEARWKTSKDSTTFAKLWGIQEPTDGNQRKFLLAKLGHFRKGKYLSVEKDKKPGLVEMVTSFEDPELTYQVNVAIIKQLNNYLLNNNKSQASENLKFVQRRLDEVEVELRANEDKFLAYSLANRSIGTPTQMLHSNRLRRAVEISQEVYLQLKKQVELAKIEERKEAPLIEVISNPQVPMSPGSRLGMKAYIVITFAGLFLGIIASVGQYFLATTLRRHASR